MEMVVCVGCKQPKARDCFYRSPRKRNGLQSRCKECNYARHKELRVDRKDYNPPKARDAWLRAKYGIGQDDYLQMVEDQNGRCAVCGDEAKLVIDHDHESGAVRGLLCLHCNVAEGHLKGDPARMVSLAAYIIQHDSKVRV